MGFSGVGNVGFRQWEGLRDFGSFGVLETESGSGGILFSSGLNFIGIVMFA